MPVEIQSFVRQFCVDYRFFVCARQQMRKDLYQNLTDLIRRQICGGCTVWLVNSSGRERSVGDSSAGDSLARSIPGATALSR